MYLDDNRALAMKFDPEMAALAEAEEARQRDTLNLIVSENYASPIATGFEGSIFTNKNAQGYPSSRMVGGCEIVNRMEQLAIDRVKTLFGVEHANVQSLSATIANTAVFHALLNYGDTVLALGVEFGGHISHGADYHVTGQLYNIVRYGFSRETETIDMDEVRAMAAEYRPKLIICGSGAYPRLVDYEAFAEIAHSVGAYLMADIAHPAGLIAAGVIPSPAGCADVITTTTHKTWRGSRGGGIIMCKKELADRIDYAVSPVIQGAPKMDMIAARAVQAKESMTPEFRAYQRQMLENSFALAQELQRQGLRLVSGGTDTHLILVDIRGHISSGKEADRVLSSVGIVVNKELLPFDTMDPELTGGIRIGTPPLTARGMGPDEMREVGRLFAETIKYHDDETRLEAIRSQVREMTSGYPLFADKWLPESVK